MLSIIREGYVSVIGINNIQCDPKNRTKINDYNITTNWCKKVNESGINEGSPTTIRRVYGVHTFQGEIKFRLTLRVISQLIRQRSDGDCTRVNNNRGWIFKSFYSYDYEDNPQLQ